MSVSTTKIYACDHFVENKKNKTKKNKKKKKKKENSKTTTTKFCNTFFFCLFQSKEGMFFVPFDAELECKQNVVVYDSNSTNVQEIGK